MKNKGLLPIILLFLTLFSCTKDNDEVVADPINASFQVIVSEDNPLRIAADNTSTGTDGLSAYWQFTADGEKVPDAPGPEFYLYETAGKYTVTLTVKGSDKAYTSSSMVMITGDGTVGPIEAPLREASATFRVGMIVQSNRLSGKHDETISRDFNSITAEYEMKMDVMYPSAEGYDYAAADKIVDFAVSRNMEVHGHALIWHNAIPGWLKDFSGTDAEFEEIIKNFITTTVQRYSGKVQSWDVVNEAIEDGSNALRNSIFKEKMGDDYIAKCYQFARDADPDVKLFYNDYNISFEPGKQAAMFKLVEDLKSQGLIDGVGAQMHISIDFPSKEQIQTFVDGVVSRDLLVHFSELDIRVNPNNDITMLTPERALAQEAKYSEVVGIYNAIPTANKFKLTVWGLRDNETWLIDFWGQPDWPLLYDDNFNRKKAYTGFLEGLE